MPRDAGTDALLLATSAAPARRLGVEEYFRLVVDVADLDDRRRRQDISASGAAAAGSM